MIGSCASCPNCPIVQQGDANFPCNFCDQVFCQNIDLKNHVRYGHEDARIFKCMHCHENYVYRSDMEKHILSAHGKCEIYKCECNFCGKVLSTRNLKHHVKSVHEEFDQNKFSIDNHQVLREIIDPSQSSFHFQRTKIAEKPDKYICLECKKEFKNKNNLKTHITHWSR